MATFEEEELGAQFIPFLGADSCMWASDYPHPDAKFPGVTEELAEALEPLSFEQQQVITSESALALYGIG